MEKIVTLKNLCKKYGKQCVLDVTEVEFAKERYMVLSARMEQERQRCLNFLLG